MRCKISQFWAIYLIQKESISPSIFEVDCQKDIQFCELKFYFPVQADEGF